MVREEMTMELSLGRQCNSLKMGEEERHSRQTAKAWRSESSNLRMPKLKPFLDTSTDSGKSPWVGLRHSTVTS